MTKAVKSKKSKRPDHELKSRIDRFVSKMDSIDKKYMPTAKSALNRPNSFKKQYDEWVAKIDGACRTEKKYLAPGRKMRLSSYRREISRYRTALRGRGVADPRYQADLKALRARFRKWVGFIDEFDLSIEDLRLKFRLFKRDLGADKGIPATLCDALLRLSNRFEHPSLQGAKLSLTQQQKSQVDREQKAALNTKQSKTVTVEASEFLLHAKRALESESYYEVVAGLALLTGRRPVELLKTGSLRPINSKEMVFSGQAKTKMSERPAFKIPVLCDSKLIKDSLTRIRGLKDFSSVDNKDVNNRTASSLGEAVKRVYGRRDLVTYDLRGIYSAVCVETILNKMDGSKGDKPNALKFLSNILGHSEDDTVTARTYTCFYLSWERKEKDILKQEAMERDSLAVQTQGELMRWKSLVDKGRKKFTRKSLIRLLDFVESKINRGELDITQSSLRKQSGAGVPVIKKFLSELGA